MGCNFSSEHEDEEEIIDHGTTSSFCDCPPNNDEEEIISSQTVDNNLPGNVIQHQNSVPQTTLYQQDFRPLKDRYFGPIKGFPNVNVQTNELIGNLVFSGWKLQTVYNKPAMVNIPFKSTEGKAVINIFSKTSGNRLVITGISRVENVFLYAMYLLKKEEMERRNGHVDELNLFHGTKKVNVQSICNNNFDWRRHGDSVGNRFGKGVSFTPKATYASHYCDEEPGKVLFLAKVLVSKAMIGDENMSIPINTFTGKVRFNDTSVKPNIDVVVKYGDNEFYPAYRISFNVQD